MTFQIDSAPFWQLCLHKTNQGNQKIIKSLLIAADIDPELGIEARSFDTTIEEMNRIQEAIVWGDE